MSRCHKVLAWITAALLNAHALLKTRQAVFPKITEERLDRSETISSSKSPVSVIITNKGYYPTVTRQLGEFLYIFKEHVENNLFVKYYVWMANFNKVIKVIKTNKYKIVMDSNGKRNRNNALNNILQSNALSRLRLALKSIANSLQTLYLKPL